MGGVYNCFSGVMRRIAADTFPAVTDDFSESLPLSNDTLSPGVKSPSSSERTISPPPDKNSAILVRENARYF